MCENAGINFESIKLFAFQIVIHLIILSSADAWETLMGIKQNLKSVNQSR